MEDFAETIVDFLEKIEEKFWRRDGKFIPFESCAGM